MYREPHFCDSKPIAAKVRHLIVQTRACAWCNFNWGGRACPRLLHVSGPFFPGSPSRRRRM